MATQPRGLRREDFQIAIICAIRCEYDAVTFAFDEIWEGAEVHLGNAPGDYNKYTLGRIANRNAVLLLLPGMGKVNAASAAVRLRSSYTGIKLAILAGICGGVPGVGTDKEILLGDVIISRCIVQYDLGRRYADKFATKDTVEDSLGRPHESVRPLTAVFETNSGRDNLQRRTNEILEEIQEKAFHRGNLYQRPPAAEDRLFESDYLHRHHDSQYCECTKLRACEAAKQGSCDELQCDSSQLLSRPRHRKRKFLDLVCNDRAHELRVVIGRLGSGDTVMKSGRDRDRIAKEQDLIAFEMEGAGIWDQFPCVVVKAICDYADSHKNKNYQNFAAARAASATKAILEAFPRTDGPPRCFSGNAESFDFISPYNDGCNGQKAPQHARDYDEKDRKLLHLLAADHEAHKNFNPRKVSGTCEWFLRDKSYREWLESTTSNIIWVSAGPGCGKSVLARALIDDGRLSSSSATSMICYFFFKDGDKHRVNSSDALSAILHQLFTQDQTRSLISRATDTFDSYGDQLRNNFYQLWKILVDCATNTAAGEIVCVLDALDECSKEGRQELFQVLETFYFGEQKHAASSQLKFLITSRPYDDLEISFERIAMAQSYIRLDGDDKSEEIRHEIDLVIDHKVNEFGKDFREEHRQAIAERLKTMDNRTYLWLHLTLSIIDEKRSVYRKPSSVQTLLSRIPSSVFDAYERILSRSQDMEQARYLLNIILTATRPLTLDEVNWALTLQAKNFMNQSEVEDDLWPRESFKTTVKNLCGLFVSVFDEKVSFIHQTAREFLTTTSGRSSTWKGTFDTSSAHGKILISCIRLLSLHDVDTMIGNEVHGRGSPLVKYALQNWMLHYYSQGSDEFCEAARELCRTASAQAPMWAWYLQREGYLSGFLYNCTDLTLACYLGLLKVVEHMLEKEHADVDSEGGYFGTATQAAAAGGHLSLVQLLLRHGATREVEGEGALYGTALEAAILEGHFEVAECLLEERGDPITNDIVHSAVGLSRNRQSIAYLVGKYRDKINITEEVLFIAVANDLGAWDTVDFLLNNYGDEIRITNQILETAADNWHEGKDIFARLLDRCGDEFDVSGKVPEIAASNELEGYKFISLLLERFGDKVDISQKVLEVAAGNDECGYDIIALILERFGDRLSVTPAVVEAAVTANVDIMSLLLEKRGYEIEITPRAIINAAQNLRQGSIGIDLLLEKRGDEVKITQEVIMAAAERGSERTMKLFMDEYENQLELTPELIQAVASNRYRGGKILAQFIEKYGGEVRLTQENMITAARNWSSADDMAVFLRGIAGNIKIAEEAVVAAALNVELGPMLFFLDECAVKITQEVVSAAKSNDNGSRYDMMYILRERRWDEVRLFDNCKFTGALQSGE